MDDAAGAPTSNDGLRNVFSDGVCDGVGDGVGHDVDGLK